MARSVRWLEEVALEQKLGGKAGVASLSWEAGHYRNKGSTGRDPGPMAEAG